MKEGDSISVKLSVLHDYSHSDLTPQKYILQTFYHENHPVFYTDICKARGNLTDTNTDVIPYKINETVK